MQVKGDYQCTKIIPNFGNIRIQTDGSGVCIKGITILIDLIVKDTDGTPKGWIPAITINSLLISLVRLGVFLLGHVTSSQKIPALRIRIICCAS